MTAHDVGASPTIEALVDQAPPLTAEQIDELRAVLASHSEPEAPA